MLSINYNVHHQDNGHNRTISTTTSTRRNSSSLHNCSLSSSISMTNIQPYQNSYPTDTYLDDDDDDDLTILFNRTKQEGFEDRISLYHNTCLRYDDVERAGPPVCALEFPKPIINRAIHCTARVLDHRSGRVQETSIFMKYSMVPDDNQNKDCHRTIRAYLVRRKISTTKSTASSATSSSTTTSLRLCTVLRRRMTTYDGRISNRTSTTAEWKTTDEQVVIKMSQLVSPTMRSSTSSGGGYHQSEETTNKKNNRTAASTKIPANANRNNGLIKEAATLQYLGNYHPNIVGCQEVLQDDKWLYIILPYGMYGSLYSNIITNKEQSIIHSPKTIIHSGPMDVDTNQRYRNSTSIDYVYENKVRCWFRQILQSLSHLQKKGVCHLDICLENIVFVNNDDDRHIAITDFSSSLRIPYNDESNFGVISDVSQGCQRRLIRIQPNCTINERLSYLAPEIINGSTSTSTTGTNNGFDGFAADLWSAGVVLFICLIGSAPFKWAHRTDYHYSLINQGKLHQLIKESNVTISSDACDLLQNMFWYNPSNRLVLSDICSHPWVVGTNTNTKTNTNVVDSNNSTTSSTGTTGTYQQQQQQYSRKTTTTTLLSSMNELLSTTKRRPPLVPSLYPRESSR